MLRESAKNIPRGKGVLKNGGLPTFSINNIGSVDEYGTFFEVSGEL